MIENNEWETHSSAQQLRLQLNFQGEIMLTICFFRCLTKRSSDLCFFVMVQVVG